ncbi:peptidyl-glycine alpha-amidating monooxygenase B-like [Antedon mediterranea]|uniref:peptidyl-glycine alpha-amidating monooxygenase B-like n=1 Tax=Antedon mediterranea TaxID=105859 RepID=UPI003AF46A4E
MFPVTRHYCLLLLFISFYGCMGYGGSSDQSMYDEDTFMQDILMPGVQPSQPDDYLCTAMSIPVDNIYIVDFIPRATMDTAHHLLLFGCDSIETHKSKAWNCGSMGTCNGPSKIIFAWARNAPSPDIPADVGFRIGREANVNFLVLQIHYGHIEPFQDGSVDNSGLTLVMTMQRQQYLAGIYLLVSGSIYIPPHGENVHTDISCEYQSSTPIYAFAFRTHSHELGRVITGYRIRNGHWQLLGKGNPQWPQAFYPMDEEYEIKYGDMVAARCSFSAPNRDTYTQVGPTGHDEMCNFYMMYYTDSELGSSFEQCLNNQNPQLFKKVLPGSDDPPPDPIGFEPGMMHHHHNEENPVEISIPAYDHAHDIDNGVHEDYVANEGDDVLLQLTTPLGKEATHQPETTMEEISSVAAIQSPQGDNEGQQLQSKAELQYVKNWPESDLGLGQVSGVAVDSKGTVHVFHRGDRVWDTSSFDRNNNFVGKSAIEQDTVVTLDKDTGSKKESWGASQFYMPHGLTIDQEDNIWLTDVALHQIFKYPAGGATQPLLTVGERLVNGNDDAHFCKPADVAVEATGEFFVADGYCNSRIVKFSPTGKLLFVFENHGQIIQLQGPLNIPHSLTLIPEKNQVCVADREQGRIVCIDSNSGQFIKYFKSSEFGSVFAIENSVDGNMYAVNGASPSGNKVKIQGFSIDIADKSILQKWSPDEGFTKPHDVAVSPDGRSVYVSEINPNSVWKFQLDLIVQEKDKKSTLSSVSEDNFNEDESIKTFRKNAQNKSPVMSKAAHAATAIVVCILIVPIVCIFIVAIFVRLRDQGHFGVIKGIPRYKSTQDRFSVGNFFNKRKGFNPVTTEGSDVEDEGSWSGGSDVEEYSRLTGNRTQNL